MKVYRDGVLIPHPVNASPAKLRSATLFIGTRSGSQIPFIGQLDDIKITGRALDPSEFMAKRSIPAGMIINIK